MDDINIELGLNRYSCFDDTWMPFKTCTQRQQNHLTESQQQLSHFSTTQRNWLIPNPIFRQTWHKREKCWMWIKESLELHPSIINIQYLLYEEPGTVKDIKDKQGKKEPKILPSWCLYSSKGNTIYYIRQKFNFLSPVSYFRFNLYCLFHARQWGI